jgi:hypothetical protein
MTSLGDTARVQVKEAMLRLRDNSRRWLLAVTGRLASSIARGGPYAALIR